jgi:hypothetical protein
MSNFKIDFFELCFLAEACIPPRPIARTMFWQNLTNAYYNQMTGHERVRLFELMKRNSWYEESLATQEDTQIFHARFDPDNQYIVTTNYNGEVGEWDAFKRNDKYYTSATKSIIEDYITKIEKNNEGKI